jgi:hypothetical protein
MEHKEEVKKIVEANKNLFSYSYDMMLTYQDHVEKMVNMSLDQAKWIPEENKKAIRDCGEYYKKFRNECKVSVDKAFTNFS